MKCFIIYTVLIVITVVKADKSEADSNASPSEIVTISQNLLKKQEKRGIDYNTLGGYTSGLGIDGTLGGLGYNGIPGYIGGVGYTGGGAIGGYNSGYYSPYTPPRVAGLGGISSYSNPGYYNSGYNSGYNGYSGYSGYNGGYGYPTAGYSSSRLGSPYTRQGYYNSYPSSYYNSQLGSSIVGGGLGGLGVGPTPVPVIANSGYQYGPGISGGIY